MFIRFASMLFLTDSVYALVLSTVVHDPAGGHKEGAPELSSRCTLIFLKNCSIDMARHCGLSHCSITFEP